MKKIRSLALVMSVLAAAAVLLPRAARAAPIPYGASAFADAFVSGSGIGCTVDTFKTNGAPKSDSASASVYQQTPTGGCYFNAVGTGSADAAVSLATGSFDLNGTVTGASPSPSVNFGGYAQDYMEMGDTVTINTPGGTPGVTGGTAVFSVNYALSGKDSSSGGVTLAVQAFVSGAGLDYNNVSGSGAGALDQYAPLYDPLCFMGCTSLFTGNYTVYVTGSGSQSASGTMSIAFPFVDGGQYLIGVDGICSSSAGGQTMSANFSCDPNLLLQLPQGDTFTSASGVFLSQATPVPEPSGLALLGIGLLGLAVSRRRAVLTVAHAAARTGDQRSLPEYD